MNNNNGHNSFTHYYKTYSNELAYEATERGYPQPGGAMKLGGELWQNMSQDQRSDNYVTRNGQGQVN